MGGYIISVNDSVAPKRLCTRNVTTLMEYFMDRITLEPGKRAGRPCIRGLRITVDDVLSMLAGGMTYQEILEDFPELTADDIMAVLAYAADQEH